MILENNKKKMSGINNSGMLIYQSIGGVTKIDVKFENEAVWRSQQQMAELFGCSVDNIGLHLKKYI